MFCPQWLLLALDFIPGGGGWRDLILRERKEIIMERKAYHRHKGLSREPLEEEAPSPSQCPQGLEISFYHILSQAFLQQWACQGASRNMHTREVQRDVMSRTFILCEGMGDHQRPESNLALRMQCALAGRFYIFVVELGSRTMENSVVPCSHLSLLTQGGDTSDSG